MIQDVERRNGDLRGKLPRTKRTVLAKFFSVSDAHLMHLCFHAWMEAWAQAKEDQHFASVEALRQEDAANYERILVQQDEEKETLFAKYPELPGTKIPCNEAADIMRRELGTALY